MDDAASQLEKMLGKEGTEYRFFIGVKLQKPEGIKSSIFHDIKEAWKEFIGRAHDVAGFDTPEMIEDEINRYKKAERRVYNKVTTRLKAEPVTEEDIQWLIRRNFYRGMSKAPILKNWSPEYTVDFKEYEEGEITVRRPLFYDVLRLSEGLVDDSPKRSLILNRSFMGMRYKGM